MCRPPARNAVAAIFFLLPGRRVEAIFGMLPCRTAVMLSLRGFRDAARHFEF